MKFPRIKNSYKKKATIMHKQIRILIKIYKLLMTWRNIMNTNKFKKKVILNKYNLKIQRAIDFSSSLIIINKKIVL